MTKAQENSTKWLYPPTLDQVNTLVEQVGVSLYKFEAFFGLPKGTIKQVRTGERQIPVKYWHVFFEPVKPTQAQLRMINKSKRKVVTNPVTEARGNPPETHQPKEQISHNRLDRLRKG